MKNVLLLTAGLLTLISLTARAQTSKLGSAGNKANYGTNQRPAIGSGSTGSPVVDGSNGSATNDGASGQSGSPAPLPAASATQQATKSNNSRNLKSASHSSRRTSSTSSRKVTP